MKSQNPYESVNERDSNDVLFSIHRDIHLSRIERHVPNSPPGLCGPTHRHRFKLGTGKTTVTNFDLVGGGLTEPKEDRRDR